MKSQQNSYWAKLKKSILVYLHLNLFSFSPNAPSSGKEDAGVIRQISTMTAEAKRNPRIIILSDLFFIIRD